MKVYADTSFLLSLYLEDDHSPKATALMQSLKGPLPLTPLHRLELRNAIRLAVFRGQVSRLQRDGALQNVEEDLEDGILLQTSMDWTHVLREAERLGAGHTESLGNRSLDILHVASALVLEATHLLTFDDRQRKLAEELGLKVRP